MTTIMIILASVLVGAFIGMITLAIFVSGDYADLGLTKQALLSDIDYLLNNIENEPHKKVLRRMEKRIKEELI